MQKVVAFDFDGTLTKRDTFFPFILRGRKGRLLGCMRELFLYPFVRDRVRLKEAFLKAAFGGIDYKELLLLGEAFSPVYRDEMLKKIEEHRKEGAKLVLVSANISPVLLPVQRKLGFDALLCSELMLDEEGRVTGRLKGANCRGEEKVRRLEEYLQGEKVFLEAYGDSAGDAALLKRADIAHWV